MPQFLLEQAIAGGSGAACNIICTQPRRISAVGLATRVAAERGEQVSPWLVVVALFDLVSPSHGASVQWAWPLVWRRSVASRRVLRWWDCAEKRFSCVLQMRYERQVAEGHAAAAEGPDAKNANAAGLQWINTTLTVVSFCPAGGGHRGLLGPPGLQAVRPHAPAVLHHGCAPHLLQLVPCCCCGAVVAVRVR